ncbi:hypothetical protein ACFV1L_30485 [Kitasatospora sp. NPDC059646]|uniref:hypothetical protein n=1 Tax=Kitasatospora sp. NPDC059646 TaxID=3346893 RepID=UPI0036B52C86
MAFGKMLAAVGTATALAFTAVGTVGSVAYANTTATPADTAIKPVGTAIKPVATDHVPAMAEAPAMGGAAVVPVVANNASATGETVVEASVTMARPSNLPTVHSDGSVTSIKPLDLTCGNFSFSGASFTETCNGSLWQPFVDCSDGNRYVSTVEFSGLFRVRLTCPVGVAVAGGAYDLS